METKINIINVPHLENADIQRTYIFDNDFRFEVNDEICINCVVIAHIPVGKIKVTEYGTSQQFEPKRIDKKIHIGTTVTDIHYLLDNNGIISRIINVKIATADVKLMSTYISSELKASTIEFE